ncbi:hypothetical protein KYB31_22740 [Clostridium felsineum]|uniref:hypothetical protein n=1 Tax=Clostridium felsineum TaxID=36839 RepID=UPI00214DE6C5|nr:hypothetical protein [Clostridium felsineum]MCR3761795.1 hypothetical protein [Clostridium felsineum]
MIMNNEIYDFKKNFDMLSYKEKDDLLKCYNVMFNCLTSVQKERLIKNYDKYKESNENIEPLYLYALKHIELNIIR